MNVTIIGSGYVGLTTGAVLAYLGNQVTLLDIDERKISLLRSGKSPIHERGLNERRSQYVLCGRGGPQLCGAIAGWKTIYRGGKLYPLVRTVASAKLFAAFCLNGIFMRMCLWHPIQNFYEKAWRCTTVFIKAQRSAPKSADTAVATSPRLPVLPRR